MPISYYVAPGLKRQYMNHYRKILKEGDIDCVIDTILKYTGIEKEKMISRNRHRPIVYTRQLITFFLREKTQLSLKTIGELIGGKDHTTAIHNISTLKDLAWSDTNVAQDISNIRNLI